MARLGDRYPNYLSGKLTLSGADTFTTDVETLPIVRPSSGSRRSTIMEFLWVDLDYASTDLIDVGDELNFVISTGSAPSAILPLSNGSVLAMKTILLTGKTSGIPILETPVRIDLTDKNGFGQLVATDRVNISGDSNGQAAAVKFNWRIYYRYVTVGAEEYIGIVQSQTMG